MVRRLAEITLHAKCQLMDLMKSHGREYDADKDVDMKYVNGIMDALANDTDLERDINFVSELDPDDDKDPTIQTNTLRVAEPWQLQVDDATTIHDLLKTGIDVKTLMKSSAWPVLQANSRRAHSASWQQQQQYQQQRVEQSESYHCDGEEDYDPHLEIGDYVSIYGLETVRILIGSLDTLKK